MKNVPHNNQSQSNVLLVTKVLEHKTEFSLYLFGYPTEVRCVEDLPINLNH